MNSAAALSLADQIARSQAAIASSRRNIARARERISEALQILGRSQSIPAPQRAEMTDEDFAEATERWEAQVQQREIDHEVRRSVWASRLSMRSA